jgi:POT family proton-dependent oligopeptide transporter
LFFIKTNNNYDQISAYKYILLFLIASIAEISISPIGLSLTNQIAPEGKKSIFMGIWLISLGLGGKLSGYISNIFSINANSNMQQIYYNCEKGAENIIYICITVIIVTMFLLLVNKKFKIGVLY